MAATTTEAQSLRGHKTKVDFGFSGASLPFDQARGPASDSFMGGSTLAKAYCEGARHMPEVLTQLKTWILQGFGFALAFNGVAYFKRSCALR